MLYNNINNIIIINIYKTMSHDELIPKYNKKIYFDTLDDGAIGGLRDIVKNKLSNVMIVPAKSLTGKITLKEPLKILDCQNVIFDFKKKIEIIGWSV
jgi:hypothetical protein